MRMGRHIQAVSNGDGGVHEAALLERFSAFVSCSDGGKGDGKIAASQFIYLFLESTEHIVPFTKKTSGKPEERNPRRKHCCIAISLATSLLFHIFHTFYISLRFSIFFQFF